MHHSPDERLRAVLLHHKTLIHPEREVIHSPAASLFGLVSEHGYTLSLSVIAEGTQQCDNANQGLRDHNVTVLILLLGRLPHFGVELLQEGLGVLSQ